MIAAIASIVCAALGFLAARFIYRNTPEERAAFERSFKDAPK